VPCRPIDPFFELLHPQFLSHFVARITFGTHLVVCRALKHSLGTLPRRSFPQLNFHRARVHRNHERPRSNGFTERAQNSSPTLTPQRERASGKALTLIGTLETLTHGNALPRKFVCTGLRTCLGERLPEKRAYAKAIFAETKRRGEGQLDAALALQPSEPKRY
jgi:hypothetical protein